MALTHLSGAGPVYLFPTASRDFLIGDERFDLLPISWPFYTLRLAWLLAPFD